MADMGSQCIAVHIGHEFPFRSVRMPTANLLGVEVFHLILHFLTIIIIINLIMTDKNYSDEEDK
jgi:hypothetical protein